MWRSLRRWVVEAPDRDWWRTQRLRDRVERSRLRGPLAGWPVVWIAVPVVIGTVLFPIATNVVTRPRPVRDGIVAVAAVLLGGAWLGLMVRMRIAGFRPIDVQEGGVDASESGGKPDATP